MRRVFSMTSNTRCGKWPWISGRAARLSLRLSVTLPSLPFSFSLLVLSRALVDLRLRHRHEPLSKVGEPLKRRPFRRRPRFLVVHRFFLLPRPWRLGASLGEGRVHPDQALVREAPTDDGGENLHKAAAVRALPRVE